MNLSDNLKKIRKDNDLSQEQLAEKLNVSRQSVSKWESNQTYPEMDKVLQICQIFNLNIDELLNQNLKEVKEKKSKNNINKYINEFLNFITKTVDMFSSLKFKNKIKCLFEQFFIGIMLFILFLIVGSISSFIINNIFSFLPYNILSIIFSLLKGLYIMISIIIGIVIFFHVFKIRYLDYYVIVKNDQEEIIDNEIKDNNDKSKKIYLKNKEKIIIRDPNCSGYKFIKALLNCLLFFIKIFAVSIIFNFLIILVFLVVCLVLSFLFIKTGLLFVGTLFILCSNIVINLLVLYILYSFIINKKLNKNSITLIFIISFLVLSISFGLIIIGFKDFNYIDDINTKNYVSSEKIIKMENDLLLDDVYYNIEYKETNLNDVKIICKHSKYHSCNIEKYDNKISLHIYQDNSNFMKQIRQYINDINEKLIVDYSKYKIVIYTSKDNIEKLKNNKLAYIEMQ